MDQAIIYNSIKTSDRIYFLKENSIFEYNHTAKSLKNHDFELKIIDLLTCVHPTTDNILFCLGISKETKIGISFIYDLSLNLIQNYVHTAPSYIFSCEIFDSEIYTFGGLLENSPKQAKKYSIAKNR